MKILHVCLGERFVDGYGYQENTLTKLHKQMGYDVFVLASTFTLIDKAPGFVKPSQYVNEFGIPVRRLPYVSWMPRKLAAKLRLYKGTYNSIEEVAPDIIFIHEATFMDVKEIARYKKNHNVRVIVDSHTDYINSGRNWLSMNVLHKIIYRWCYQQVVPIAEKFFGTLPIRNLYLKDVYHVPEEKIELLPMGIDLSGVKNFNRMSVRNEMRTKLGYSEEDFVIVTGGKLEKRKNTIELIKAESAIEDSHVKLFLFGNIADNIREDAEALLKDNSKVLNWGWVKSEEIYQYLLVGDLCVFPGTHSAIWEQAVGLGLPCVFKHWDNITHIDLGGNCKLIDDTSVSGITDVIMELRENPSELQKMKDIAETKGPTVFSYEEIAKRAIGVS